MAPVWIAAAPLDDLSGGLHGALRQPLHPLRLPYYWDEAGYYIPAAWDFFRTGSLIPITTLTNAHPPLPSIYLALWWKLSGFYPEVTREAVLMVAALGAARRLAPGDAPHRRRLGRLLDRPPHRPLSHLVRAELACPCGHLCRRLLAVGTGLFAPRAAAANPGLPRCGFPPPRYAKETAIAIPLTLAAVSLVESFGAALRLRTRLWREAAWLCACVLPLAAWYAYHYAKTGFLFGNPEFLRYNAQATLAPLRIAGRLRPSHPASRPRT